MPVKLLSPGDRGQKSSTVVKKDKIFTEQSLQSIRQKGFVKPSDVSRLGRLPEMSFCRAMKFRKKKVFFQNIVGLAVSRYRGFCNKIERSTEILFFVA